MYIIFDMDGLMFDTEKVFIMAWDYAGKKIGIGKAGYMVYKNLEIDTIRKSLESTQKNFCRNIIVRIQYR